MPKPVSHSSECACVCCTCVRACAVLYVIVCSLNYLGKTARTNAPAAPPVCPHRCHSLQYTTHMTPPRCRRSLSVHWCCCCCCRDACGEALQLGLEGAGFCFVGWCSNYTYVFVHWRVHARTHHAIHVHINLHVHLHVHTYTCTHTNTYSYTYTHTLTRT